MNRWLELDGVVNMRDVGGLPTRDGGQVRRQRLIRSDNLQDLTSRDMSRLVSDFEVTDILDLRTDVERELTGPAPLEQSGSVTHHHHSLIETGIGSDARLATIESALVSRPRDAVTRDADYWTQHYLNYLARRGPAVASALGVIARAHGATIAHCAAGKDRTGTVVGLALDVAGVPHEEIVADYAMSGERIERILERLMTVPFYGETLRHQKPEDQLTRPETMAAILATLTAQHGGAAGWLREQGWSAEDVARLRSRLVD